MFSWSWRWGWFDTLCPFSYMCTYCILSIYKRRKKKKANGLCNIFIFHLPMFVSLFIHSSICNTSTQPQIQEADDKQHNCHLRKLGKDPPYLAHHFKGHNYELVRFVRFPYYQQNRQPKGAPITRIRHCVNNGRQKITSNGKRAVKWPYLGLRPAMSTQKENFVWVAQGPCGFHVWAFCPPENWTKKISKICFFTSSFFGVARVWFGGTFVIGKQFIVLWFVNSMTVWQWLMGL